MRWYSEALPILETVRGENRMVTTSIKSRFFEMKRFLLSTLTVLMSMGAIASTANAAQVSLGNPIADLNEDGRVTLHEVVTYNRDQRDKN